MGAGAILPSGPLGGHRPGREAAQLLIRAPRWASYPWHLPGQQQNTEKGPLSSPAEGHGDLPELPLALAGPTGPPARGRLMNPPQLGPTQWHVVRPVGAIVLLTHQGCRWGHEAHGCTPATVGQLGDMRPWDPQE